MMTPNWAKAIKSCADPQRAKHFVNLLAAIPQSETKARLEKFSEKQIHVLVALFSGSQALSDLLIANPSWLEALDIEHIQHPRRAQGFRVEVNEWVRRSLVARDFEDAFSRLRQFKQREMLRIAARDLARLGDVVEITREVSDVADVCLDSVWRIVSDQFTGRFGRPYHPDTAGHWHETAFCVLGLGKLGGQELNYSSDVDVMFLYADEGQVFKEPPTAKKSPPRTMSSHAFFNRLAEAFIAEVTRLTPEGVLFRIDLRLRPEGDAGPLCRSLESYETYYAQWGQTWERMMLIKTRCVAGDGALATEFLEMIQPFRFPRSVNERVLREIAAVKDRIEHEVVRAGELERNVKLGRGGIREIEFVVQSLQLLHAGRQPFLQNSQTLPCLAKLAQYKLLAGEDARELDMAYRFLRDVEHRLQMESNLQTHTIPHETREQERLAKLMGFATRQKFEAARRRHTGNVRRVYDGLFRATLVEPKSPFPQTFDAAEPEWKEILTDHGFRDADKAFRVLKEFAEGPGYVHVSPRTTELAQQLLPKLFALCPKAEVRGQKPGVAGRQSGLRPLTADLRVLSDPDRVVMRLDNFISAYGTRATLFELWTGHPLLFDLLLLLFDRSEFLAETVIRSPELFDELVVGDRLRQRKTAQNILENLRHGLHDADQFLWLRRYHEAELLRLGSRDILGLVDFEQNLGELSGLADACLQYALEVVMRKNKIKSPPFVIIGLGKLGGGEITYGSDLDIIFVADSKAKDLPKLQQMAVELMDLMSRRTEKGMVFPTDARLRPDGEKGLLVNTLAAYEEYYRHRAQLWEIQSLTRARTVAGDFELGERICKLAADLTDFKSHSRSKKSSARKNGASCGVSYTLDWKKKISAMRMRIENERTPAGQNDLAIKTGAGGLMDGEFIAQTLCLAHGWREPHTLRALERGHHAGALPGGERLMENYKRLRRVEGILRRWSYEGETVLPDDPAAYHRVAVRCGFPTSEGFRKELAKWRQEIRASYNKFFGAVAGPRPGRK